MRLILLMPCLFVTLAITAPAQFVPPGQPPVIPPAPPLLVDLDAKVAVLRPDGTPWVGEIEVVGNFAGNASVVSSDYGTPNSLGEFTAHLKAIDHLAFDGAPFQIEVRVSPATLLPPANEFYFDPSLGVASFPEPLLPSWSNASSAFQVATECVMSPPPKYGELMISNPHQQSLTLVCQDFDVRDAANWMYGIPHSHRVAVPLAQGVAEIYRWSHASASRIAIFGPRGAKLYSGLLRRTAVHPVTVPLESLYTVAVSSTNYPTAHWVIFVDPNHHEPAPGLPSGSAVNFEAQRARCLATQTVDFNGTNSVSAIALLARDYVLELWSRTIEPSGELTFRLVASRAVLATDRDPVISF
jgi:hypothetical protein